MHIELTDKKLSELFQSVTNELRRRAQINVNGYDVANMIWANEMAKRAATVAITGGHSILFFGTMNSGKTMLRALCLELGLANTFEARSCVCGNYGDYTTPCTCTVKQIAKTVKQFPVAEINIEVQRPRDREINQRGTSLEQIRQTISMAAKYQDEKLDETSLTLLKCAAREIGLDPAAQATSIRIARTIANLDGSRIITASHIAEAINYRPPRVSQ